MSEDIELLLEDVSNYTNDFLKSEMNKIAHTIVRTYLLIPFEELFGKPLEEAFRIIRKAGGSPGYPIWQMAEYYQKLYNEVKNRGIDE